MATLNQLYARIVLDTNRDDLGPSTELEQAKIDAVADAIELHADELFWFNRASASGTTSAGQAALPMPAGIRLARTVAHQGAKLEKRPLEALEHRGETGRPAQWAENEGAIQLWPVPDGAYVLAVFGLAAAGLPASGDESNCWTTEAYRLILSAAKKILYRDVLRDSEGAMTAAAAEEEALTRLRRETRRRSRAGLVSDLGAAPGFDIDAG